MFETLSSRKPSFSTKIVDAGKNPIILGFVVAAAFLGALSRMPLHGTWLSRTWLGLRRGVWRSLRTAMPARAHRSARKTSPTMQPGSKSKRKASAN
jgi:hypothetical protein